MNSTCTVIINFWKILRVVLLDSKFSGPFSIFVLSENNFYELIINTVNWAYSTANIA